MAQLAKLVKKTGWREKHFENAISIGFRSGL